MTVLSKPRLFGPSYSAYVRVARLALAEKDIDYELVPVEVFEETSKAVHLARHPFGKVPVFEHGDYVLYETAAICRYIDAAFDGPILQPADPKALGRMAQMISIIDAYLYKALVWDVFVQEVVLPREGGTTDPDVVRAGASLSKTALAALAGLLSDQPFVAGDGYSLADAHLAPMLDYGTQSPTGADLIGGHPALGDWLKRIYDRASWPMAITEPGLNGSEGR
ncbi:MAG: glutathione S-transferase family protein [Pseudomonadota bacterium]